MSVLQSFHLHLLKIAAQEEEAFADSTPEGATLPNKEVIYETILKKYPGLAASLPPKTAGLMQRAGDLLVKHEHPLEAAGLATLMAIPADRAQARARAFIAGKKDEHSVEKRELFGPDAREGLDAAGLGMMLAPLAVSLSRKGH